MEANLEETPDSMIVIEKDPRYASIDGTDDRAVKDLLLTLYRMMSGKQCELGIDPMVGVQYEPTEETPFFTFSMGFPVNQFENVAEAGKATMIVLFIKAKE
jgi:hypothetical protein